MVRPDEVLERPKRFSTPELAKVNVTIVALWHASPSMQYVWCDVELQPSAPARLLEVPKRLQPRLYLAPPQPPPASHPRCRRSVA